MKEVMIKDKVNYIAGPNLRTAIDDAAYGEMGSVYAELEWLRGALKEKEADWVTRVVKKADEAFKEAAASFLADLKRQSMSREGDEELFKYLQDKFLLTFVRAMK